MTNPLIDPYLILNKVYCGGKYLKQAISETPAEPQNKPRTVKICYGVLEKDVYFDYIIGANTKKPPKAAVKTILKIALYMLEFMQKHDYMVVDYAVELTKKLGKEGASGFVNAFLRSYKVPPAPEKSDEKLAFSCSYPLWLVKKLKRSYKNEAADIMLAETRGICVRFCKNEGKYLDKKHIGTPFESAYIFESFVRDSGFYDGDYTFQSVGSLAICSVISAGERLLDACSAPGGKAVLLSDKFKEITACELHAHRVELIKSYASRMNVKNVFAMQADSAEYREDFKEKFDAVLCDAPCSGTGVINENPDIKLFRKEEDIKNLCDIQQKILSNCAKYVKRGGALYYSTCSVLPEENDSAVFNFLRDNPDFALDIPDCPLAHRKGKFGLQFLPHISLGAGFFVTRLVKKQ